MTDFEGVLDPAEEQFDLPATLVKFGDLVGRSIEIVGDDAQILPVSVGTRSSRTGSETGFLRYRLPRGQMADRSDRMAEPVGTRFAVTPASGVLTFNRVTIRHPASRTWPTSRNHSSPDRTRKWRLA